MASLVDKVSITISPAQVMCNHHFFHDEVLTLLLSMTTAFDTRRLSLTILQKRQKDRLFDLDKFMSYLSVRRPELIFDKFTYTCDINMKQDCVNGLEILFGKCETLILDGFNCRSTILHENMNPFVLQLRNLDISNSSFSIPHFPEERRPMPQQVKLQTKYN